MVQGLGSGLNKWEVSFKAGSNINLNMLESARMRIAVIMEKGTVFGSPPPYTIGLAVPLQLLP